MIRVIGLGKPNVEDAGNLEGTLIVIVPHHEEHLLLVPHRPVHTAGIAHLPASIAQGFQPALKNR
jgi:hypothetical protein